MNVSDLARRLKVTPHELLEKLPELGFDIGGRAIKIDDRLGENIFKKWIENERRERVRGTLLAGASQGRGESSVPVTKKEVQLPPVIIVRELAGKLNLPVTSVIQQLMRAGILASQNERLDFETAAIISEELGFRAARVSEDAAREAPETLQATNRLHEVLSSEAKTDLQPRPPVVVVMGHVDHGKTRTLDAIRTTHVMEEEAGGITQHIGAYQVVKKGRDMTFIDTPGHEAFTVMRSRGARIADIAILVVAADDGVQPQTKEAMNIIQAAKLPFVVALNKVDKPEADPDRVLAQLAEAGVTTDAWGGQIPLVKISAKTGQGIDALLDTILLVADLHAENIRANPNRRAIGTVIEAHVDKGEGPVATALIQSGTLHQNEYIGISGAAYGRVRVMRDWTGRRVDAATPGMPVRILGFKVAPGVGDIIEVPEHSKTLEIKKLKTAHQVVTQLTAVRTVEADEDKKRGKKTLNVVLKCDTLGSLEALLGMLEKIRHDDVGVEVIQKGLGNVTEGDVLRAINAPPAVVHAFHVVVTPQAAELARDAGIDVKTHKVIYELFDNVIDRLNSLMPPEVFVTPLGNFETVAIFRTESGRMVIGGKVIDGNLVSGEKARVWRGEEPIGIGIVDSLQIGKQNVKAVQQGQECGMSFKGKTKIHIGDRLEVYHEDVKERKVKIV